MKSDDALRRRCALRRGAAATLVCLTTLAAGGLPSAAGDVEQGRQLSVQWCSTCHLLPGNPNNSTVQGPPSFRDIARGTKTPEQLRVFLMNPHGAMPPLTLSRTEIDDLLAYILSLR